jgi:hypothetical protein
MPNDAVKYPMKRWKVMGMNFVKHALSSNIALELRSHSTGSYQEPCPNEEFEKGMRGFPCGWLIPNYSIACSSDSILGERKEIGIPVIAIRK